MSRKTTWQRGKPMTLTAPTSKTKLLEDLIWQFLFDNRGKAFTAIELKKAFAEKGKEFDRTHISKVAKNLIKESRKEGSKTYAVYKINSSYRVFENNEYKKYETEENKEKTLVELVDDKIVNISNLKMRTNKKAISVNLDCVYFFPIQKGKANFTAIRNALNELFGNYIVAILEGENDGKSGFYIIVKPYNNIKSIENLMEYFYEQLSLADEK